MSGNRITKQPSSLNHTNILTQEDSLLEIKIISNGKLVIGNLNINSIANKFDELKVVVGGNLDILVITETKLDSTFSTNQFHINGFSKPYRRDRDRNGGGIMIYIREDIPSRKLSPALPNDIETLFIEINLRKYKWLLCGCYHPPNQADDYFFHNLGLGIDKYSQYDRFLLAGDFNAEITENIFANFLENYDANNIVKDKTCFKSVVNPSCIDLFVTNKPSCFQNTRTICTGLSDFHKMVVTVFKVKFEKNPPKKTYYRNYKFLIVYCLGKN